MARSVRGSAVGKHFDKAVTKHVCAKALDQAVHEGWLIEDVNYVRARPNQETPIHGRFVPTSICAACSRGDGASRVAVEGQLRVPQRR